METQQLRKILQLEIKRGYDDGAVMKGLDSFLETWLKKQIKTAPDPGIKAIISRAKPTGLFYGTLDIEQRREFVNRALRWLDEMDG
ncbi:MAG: hypothetical protein U1D67_10040, partial [Dehalococcoidia bacterium]|nr:hypothetical protein [Dehalococcoidia bacterium]